MACGPLRSMARAQSALYGPLTAFALWRMAGVFLP